MSKQLAISAAASVFAMVASVLMLTPSRDLARDDAGAMANAAAPATMSMAAEAVAGLRSIVR